MTARSHTRNYTTLTDAIVSNRWLRQRIELPLIAMNHLP